LLRPTFGAACVAAALTGALVHTCPIRDGIITEFLDAST
jgi:hypothetical protein